MSGTSLDGLDIAAVTLIQRGKKITHQLHHADTIAYPSALLNQLEKAIDLSGFELMRLDAELGRWMGDQVKAFLRKTGFEALAIASHGHTVHHQPDLGFTVQIGSLAHIASCTETRVVGNFRAMDVALGGQGAPLVPIGDEILYPDMSACVNLGGIANVSYSNHGKRIAFDIALCNIPLNHFAKRQGLPFDRDGLLSSRGVISQPLLEQLNMLPYYHEKAPKSIGREMFDQEVLPILLRQEISDEDIMRTWCAHAGAQVGRSLNDAPSGPVLVTGGGAFHPLLIEEIKRFSQRPIFIPDSATIQFKEAIIFALLGYLRLTDQINVYASVTGASRNQSAGAVV